MIIVTNCSVVDKKKIYTFIQVAIIMMNIVFAYHNYHDFLLILKYC